MKRSGKIKWGNLSVGLLVTFAMAMLLYSSFRGGGTSMFDAKGELVIYFKNVNGLVRGAPVWLGGVEVGNVRKLEFVNLDEQRRIEAVITIKRSVWQFITLDTKVKLGTIGLLGDKYVEIIPGSKALAELKSGTTVPVLDEGGLDGLMQKAPAMTSSVDSLLTNLKNVSKQIAEGKGAAGRIISDTILSNNLAITLAQAAKLLTEVQANQQKIMDRLSTTLENAQRLTAKIDSGQGTLGKLIQNDTLYNNLSRSTVHLDSLLAKIDRGEGSAGALVNDRVLYEQVRDLVTRLNNLVADIEKNPRKYFKFSVF